MKYFRNSELTRLYNVSDKAVRNWIASAQAGKILLKLHIEGAKVFISDTIRNRQIMEELTAKGKKYRNRRSHRNIEPSRAFYELFSRGHIIDIMNRLEKDHELPWEYTCFGEGGEYWDKYLTELHEAGSGNLITNTNNAYRLCYAYLDALLESYKYVNIVNVCVGNFLNAKDLVEHVHGLGKLKRVVAIDISSRMLEISKNNIEKWFQGHINLETYARDINQSRIDDVLTRNAFGDDAHKTINIVLFTAGPIKNFKKTDELLATFEASMAQDDILITTLKRDTSQARNFFDFNLADDRRLLSAHDGLLVRMLNIDDTFYDLEQIYNDEERARHIQIRLKVDLSIHFELDNYKKVIELTKGDVILLMRVKHFSDEDLIRHFLRANFTIHHISRSLDEQLIMLITKVQKRSEL